MVSMLTPKEALIKDGFPGVKPGKGRLSRAADARCKELAANGVNIKGYAVDNSVSNKSTDNPVVKKVKAGNEKVVNDFTILYDERDFKALDSNRKEWGMREVCNTCRVSLVQNMCDNPTILGGIAVKIVPR